MINLLMSSRLKKKLIDGEDESSSGFCTKSGLWILLCAARCPLCLWLRELFRHTVRWTNKRQASFWRVGNKPESIKSRILNREMVH